MNSNSTPANVGSNDGLGPWSRSARPMVCDACKARGKTREGSDPKCGFPNGRFSLENWNCASLNALRDLVYEGQDPMPSGVDYRYCEDQKYATVQVETIEGAGGALALWVTWYKSRGGTDAVWLLFSSGEAPRPPTEDELMAVVRHYSPNVEVTGHDRR